jgi:hypothetical protein
MTISDAHKRAAEKYRAKRRRVELTLDPRSDESRILDRLIEVHGSLAAAIRFALLKA